MPGIFFDATCIAVANCDFLGWMSGGPSIESDQIRTEQLSGEHE
jgi:hypothetical protein